MASVINTNIAATRTHNVYNRNNDYMNQALSRVATGMKVNSAKDNASTWAISEKMRERIRANDQANQNVQNDTALLKTAEGGISNTIDILKTLKERAVNAANDSNMNTDRSVIAEEVRQLVKQIDDNAEKVKFNGRTLLKGTAGDDTAATLSADPDVAATSGTGAAAATTTPKPTNAVYSLTFNTGNLKRWDSGASPAATVSASTSTTFQSLVKADTTDGSDTLFASGDKIVFSWTENGTAKSAEYEIDATAYSSKGIKDISATGSGATISFNETASTSGTLTDAAGNPVKGVDSTSGTATETSTFNLAANTFYFVGTANTNVANLTVKVTDSSGVAKADATALFGTANTDGAVAFTNVQNPAAASTNSSSQLTFHIGGEQDFSINMTLNDMTSTGSILNLGSDFAEKFLNSTDAKGAIGTIDNALNAALKEQTRIGAYENRLGYASDNLTTMNENLEAADSVMRDSDIAKEMTQYMKYAVLSQASQYMLAQAGQNAFQVLNLLQQ